MIRVGLAGIGFMGWIHWLAYQKSSGIEVAAICSRDEKKRAGDWRDIQGNFGPPGEQVDLSGIATYETLDEMLQDESLDVIDLCLPPHLHEEPAIAALKAGKHVFCEKPMAVHLEACDRMADAAARHERQLFIGQVLAMFPEYAFALQQARDGAYGRVLGGHFKRVISDPTWLPDFYDPEKCGGPLIDLHVHDAHFIRLLFGMPTGVESRGRMRGEVVEYCDTLFDFEDSSLVVSATCGVINQQGRPFTHGFEVHFERATLQYEFAVIGGEPVAMLPLTVMAEDGSVSRPELGDGDPVAAFVAEVQEVARCVEANQPSDVMGSQLARDAIELCHRQTASVRG